MGLLGFGSREEEEEEVEGKGGKKLINFPPGHPIRGRGGYKFGVPRPIDPPRRARLGACSDAGDEPIEPMSPVSP